MIRSELMKNNGGTMSKVKEKNYVDIEKFKCEGCGKYAGRCSIYLFRSVGRLCNDCRKLAGFILESKVKKNLLTIKT